MSTPFYVAPEQVMKDRADYARKGIARGRSIIASTYEDGIIIVAENPSNTLHKVSEIYDRIGFAGVGRYNEFDQPCVSRASAMPTSRASTTAVTTSTRSAWQISTRRSWGKPSPTR